MKRFVISDLERIGKTIINEIKYNSDKMKSKQTIDLTYDKICNMIVTFDTETSLINKSNGGYYDILQDKSKYVAYNYIQMININGDVYYTRYIQDMAIIFDYIETLAFNYKCNIIIYIHNLGFDFTFIRQYLNTITKKKGISRVFDVFARTAHKPIRINWRNLTLKCSYVLSNMSLDMCAKTEKLSVNKKIGQLDYEKIRHSETVLSDSELEYCEYDVIVLYEYIKKKRENENGHLRKIPLTSTSYVRRELLKHYGDKAGITHLKTVKKQEDFQVFKLLQMAYTGGFCYANPMNSRVICENVTSLDFTSSYPAVCLRKKFPVGVFKKIEGSQSEMKKLLKNENTASVFHVIFQGVKSKSPICTLSSSKCNIHSLQYYDNTALQCDNKENWRYIECNGKISQCWIVDTVFTDIDMKIFDLFYTYEKYCICEMYTSKYDYLDDCFRTAILKAYKEKTQLKGCTDSPENLTKYNNSKAFINSLYGCCCFNIMNDSVIFNENDVKIWQKSDKTIDDYYDYYDKHNVILPYQYGVWITAWARYELLSTVARIKTRHFVYSDTDSIKLLCYENTQIDKKGNKFTYKQRIEKINDIIIAETLQALSEKNTNIDINDLPINPTDVRGKKHHIGVFTDEGQCRYLKTLGAKRYLNTDFFNRENVNSTEYDNVTNFYITCAGVDKQKTSDYFTKTYKNFLKKNNSVVALDKTFEIFDDCMILNSDICGRTVHYYTSLEMSDYEKPEHKYIIEDYNGVKAECILSDCVTITKSTFTLTMEEMHLDYICNWHKMETHTDYELDGIFEI